MTEIMLIGRKMKYLNLSSVSKYKHKHTLVTRASIKASGRSVRSRGMRGSGGLRIKQPRLLRTRGRSRRPRSGHGGRRHQLPLPTPCGRHPRALYVRGAIEPSALAARPTPPVCAVLLRLVPAVLARRRPRPACRRPPNSSSLKQIWWRIFQVILVLGLLILLP